MKYFRRNWILGMALMLISFIVPVLLLLPIDSKDESKKANFSPEYRGHFDHSMYFTEYSSGFTSPQQVTKACMACHEDSAEAFLKSSHWTWTRSTTVQAKGKQVSIGKKNLINNFCINITGNWPACTKCHAGYGWKDDSFDFENKENIDCLICHDNTGTYVKGKAGLPRKGVDLLKVARGVGFPKRDNCGMCHFSGGGGMGVKHGDMDDSLIYAVEKVDVHMGREDMLCIDCHKTKNHQIPGTAFSVSVHGSNQVSCLDCHSQNLHKNERLNSHAKTIACQTCHIPYYAKRSPTKMTWDWSKAGDPNRKEDPHEYLKIKGEFTYQSNVVPEYHWFNQKVDRYLLGDKMNPDEYTDLNRPQGDINDPKAKIWPFKIHLATQPYDKKLNQFMPVVTAGEGGFWREFNWPKAIRLGAKVNHLEYSGEYGFARSRMFWPLSHMVSPSKESLSCTDCHSNQSRMDFKALGYKDDPAKIGGRQLSKKAGK